VSLLSYQLALGTAVFASDPPESAFAALGDSSPRWKVYRRMARARLAESIAHAFERFSEVVGPACFGELVTQFLAEAPPRSHYLRDVPGEFLRFFEKNEMERVRAQVLPDYALDLARYEWAELETAYAYDEAAPTEVGPLQMDAVAVLTPAHRLIDVGYPVHRLETAGHGLDTCAAPFSLCLYRDPKTHQVETLELTAVTAAMLSLLEGRNMTLTEVVKKAAALVGASLDVAFVEALSTLLADLIQRGVLLGSLVSKETS
jgi:uncharacterized protein